MTEQLFWIDSAGSEHLLTDSVTNGVIVLWGVADRYMPPFRRVEEVVPFTPGTRLRDIQADVREIDIPIEVFGATRIERQANLRAWTRVFNPLFGDGKLRNIAEDGTTRELTCRYVSGFEIDESLGAASVTSQFAIVSFRAFDPFWYDVNVRGIGFVSVGTSATFFPFFPLTLSGSEIFGEQSVSNFGDEVAFPVWTINGPCSDIQLIDATTGEAIVLDITLDLGDSVVIDTRPGAKTVLKSDGTDLFTSLSVDSVLWALPVGTIAVQVEMGGTTGDTSVLLEWNERFFGP